MRLEVSDEVGTEGFGMRVIEGCDTAKDFSIKAPQCARRSSEGGCLLAEPGDQSWKTTPGATPRALTLYFSIYMCIILYVPCMFHTRARARTRAQSARGGEQSGALQRAEELRLTPGYRRAPVIREKMNLVLHDSSSTQNIRSKRTETGGRKNEDKRSTLHQILSVVNIFHLGYVMLTDCVGYIFKFSGR